MGEAKALNKKEDEIFLDIKGYEGKYQIGNRGTVRSMMFVNNQTSFRRVKILSQTDNGYGYLIVNLKKDGKRKSAYVHRLVAEAFLPRVDGKNVINHIDFNKKNNRVENLEWCTQQENVLHSVQFMKKPKQYPIPNSTGEKYIVKDNRKGHGQKQYRVVITQLKVDKTFSDLPVAIEYRDKCLQDNGVLSWVYQQ